MPGSKAIYRNVNKSLNFRILYLIPYPLRLGYRKDPSWARCYLHCMETTSFEFQNIANHSSMWMTPKSSLGSPPANLTTLSLAVNENLKQISIWCCRNSLPINPDKTKLLYVGVPQLMRTLPTPLPSAKMLGTQIKPVTVAKDLGVYIGCHLIFNEHITKTASDCIFKLTRANRIKHLLDQKTLIYLINAFVRRDGVARAETLENFS